MADKQPSIEDFRSSIEDLVTIADKLSGFCNSVEELVGLLNLALTNDAQLKIIIQAISQQVKR